MKNPLQEAIDTRNRLALQGQAGPGYNQYGQSTATAAQGQAVLGVRGDSTMNQNKSAQINYMDAYNPETVALQNALLRAYMSGSGEYGLGAGMKQAQATLGQGAASRGISPQSGAYQSMMAKMFADALGQDAMQRQQYGLNLMQANPAYYNSMQLQLGKQQQPGFGQFAGNILGTGLGAVTGGFGSALGNKWGG